MSEINTKWSVKGKWVVITGATSGIGLAAAKELAKRGAILGLIARNRAKADEVAAQLVTITGGSAIVDIFEADMSSQNSIRRVAADIGEKWPRVDILINNAGAMFTERELTEDGIEMTWAVNHLAPFLLTSLLLDKLKESGHSRVITTASHGHKMARNGIRFDDIRAERLYRFPQKYIGGPSIRYGETKLANILFTAELARRLEKTGVTAHCFDPGLVSTNFNSNNKGLSVSMTMALMKLLSRSPEKGAETLVWLADSDDIAARSGGYYTDMQLTLPTVHAQNMDAAKRLWDISENQTGLR
ncbi:SDR family NAD(P)-dependent oxidoreductase [Paenibacillus rigui]|uniref:Short-chain dehydrogenase n=1 Tax=Paenibacillus rigui TaxID=554312 RepID=A0A229UHG7_9BACL|nr:SDR family NAD(P)-dependent oxidoreductase [Paenibacillus rigui]OXM82858.1 short-chain dehydrogenase [Paenibacillus rigui]